MWPDLRAEAIVQWRRPANWLLLGTSAGLTATFAYVIPYAGFRAGTTGSDARALDEMLPASFADVAIGGLPAFIGALALIFGVLVAGSEYSWGTWKTLLVQQPSRLAVLTGKLGVLTAGTFILVGTLLAVSSAASLAVAGLEDAATSAPSVAEIVTDLAVGWLIALMWAMLGVALAVSMRAVALPVGIGLVWMLAVQNLITALAAPLLDWVDAAQQWLPGPAAGSLVAGLGASQNTPGVAELASQTQSVLVLFAYLTAFMVTAAMFLRIRDI